MKARWKLRTHTSKLLPELEEDSTLEQGHMIAIGHVKLQPHGGVQLTIVFHHPFLHSLSIHSTLFHWWTISWCRCLLLASHTCLSGHSYHSILILSVHYQILSVFCPVTGRYREHWLVSRADHLTWRACCINNSEFNPPNQIAKIAIAAYWWPFLKMTHSGCTPHYRYRCAFRHTVVQLLLVHRLVWKTG